MAERTVKTLEAGNDNGWWVIQLTDIDAPLIAANDPLVLATLRELGPSTGEEYVRQFVTAAQREVGVERNETAIQAVAAQLTGQQAE
jgi:peptidyl-prolyl cis-trans isomerase D